MNPGDLGRQAAERAAQQARENHQRFVDTSTRTSLEAQRRVLETQRQIDMDRRRRGGGGGSGVLGTIIGLVILAVIVYVAYTFVTSSGLLR